MNTPLFFNIAPFSPGCEAETARDMIEYVERTGNDTVLYSLSFHAEGRPALSKTERLLESYRALKRELKGSKVRLGMLLQSTLGHWTPVGDDNEKWQRTVTLTGEGIRFCPLDPGHRAFLSETVRRAAAERPAVMMIDDDVTGFKHSAECFCPLHLAEFERRTGRRFSCDELRKIVADRSDAELVAAFEKMQEDMVLGVARLVRDAIDSVDPSIQCCACMPWGEPWRAGRTAQTVAAAGKAPVLRTCNGQYSEFLGDNFADRVLVTQYFTDMWKTIPNLLDESDTFPHNLWSKSARSFHAKLAASFFCGLNGAKLWFVNARRAGFPISRNYTDILARHRGYYGALMEAIRDSVAEGVKIPVGEGTGLWDWSVYSSGWVKEVFAIYGIPFRAESDLSKEGIWAVAGADRISRMSDDDIRALLSHRVLIDGPAAEALTKRGFEKLLGTRVEKLELIFHGEEMDDIALKLTPSTDKPVLTPLPESKWITNLVRRDAARGTKEVVGPGVTLFDNELGGCVAVTTWHPEDFVFNRRSEHRQAWIGKILDALADNAFPVRSADAQNTLALAARATDGSLLVQVFNLCYDPLESISLTVPAAVKKTEYLDDNGNWREIGVSSQSNGIISVPLELGMMQERVLRLS